MRADRAEDATVDQALPIGRLDRASTARLVADARPELIAQVHSGSRCQERQLTAALAVSRSTLRGGFQIRIPERLRVREPHRGVFVRRQAPADVRDTYTVRRLIECGAVAGSATSSVGSPRIERRMRALLAELRPAFQLVADSHALHEPFLDRNQQLVKMLDDGRSAAAGTELAGYLDDAERLLLAALDT